MESNYTSLFQQLDWWRRQDRGTFDLLLYLRICAIKQAQNL